MTVCDKDILFKWFYASYECPKPSWKSGLHFSYSQMPRRGWYCLKSQCISYFKLNIYTCEFFFHFRKWEVYLSCLPNAFMMPGEFPCSASIFFTKYPKNSIFAYLCILINYCPVYYEYIGNPIVEIRRSSYLHNGISYTGKMSSLYWIMAQVIFYMLRQSIVTTTKCDLGHLGCDVTMVQWYGFSGMKSTKWTFLTFSICTWHSNFSPETQRNTR